MARESAVRQRIGEALREAGFFVQAIESPTTPGMPDTYYRLNRHVVGWIEFKKVDKWPAKATTSLFRSMNHPLSNEQANWIGKELEKGGRADIVVAHERDYYMIPGIYADVFNDLSPETITQYKVTKQQIISNLKDVLYYDRDDL